MSRDTFNKNASSFPTNYLNRLQALEPSYLQSDDPIRQSGFGGGAQRWRAEREPILDAIEADGDFLDIGCANGYLLECLIEWGHARSIRLTPYGLDLGAKLIELAQQRLPHFAEHFFVGNSWDWQAPRQFRYVYTLYESVPDDLLPRHIQRLLAGVVEPGGRLIIGAYGSKSQQLAPFAIGDFLRSLGYRVAGERAAGDPVIVRFAWVDNTNEVTDEA